MGIETAAAGDPGETDGKRGILTGMEDDDRVSRLMEFVDELAAELDTGQPRRTPDFTELLRKDLQDHFDEMDNHRYP